jgi:hypothetical protein
MLLDATLVRMNLNGTRAEADPNRAPLHGMRSWSFQVARRAHALGIPFVTGTDLMGRPSVDPSAAVHDELELLVTQAGHSPAEAIRAATLHGARMLGREREQGTVEVGKLADLVILSADPLTDIRNTRRVVYIIKAGELHEPALSKQILQLAQTRTSLDTTLLITCGQPRPLLQSLRKELLSRLIDEHSPGRAHTVGIEAECRTRVL